MQKQTFKNRLHQQSGAIGTLLTTASPEAAEAIGQCGFDWLFIDGEHGGMEGSSLTSVVRSVAAARTDCHILVRIPDSSSACFKKALDSGADGLIVPLIKTADEARFAVKQSKYPPLGERSVGIGRAHGYGMNFREYIEHANDSVALVLQIEHIQAVKNLNEILAVPGIDAILVGPYDLSGSMGILGGVQDPRVLEVVANVRSRCNQKRMPVGLFVMEPDRAIQAIKDGFQFVAVGTDLAYMWVSAARALKTVREGLTSG